MQNVCFEINRKYNSFPKYGLKAETLHCNKLSYRGAQIPKMVKVEIVLLRSFKWIFMERILIFAFIIPFCSNVYNIHSIHNKLDSISYIWHNFYTTLKESLTQQQCGKSNLSRTKCSESNAIIGKWQGLLVSKYKPIKRIEYF